MRHGDAHTTRDSAEDLGELAVPACATEPCDDPFWSNAIDVVRQKHPEFVLMAEVYWDMQEQLLEAGFNYAYDKTLYDRLRSRDSRRVREHLFVDIEFQIKMVRFLENHDEPRAAQTFPADMHKAAAVINYLSPGLRFFL